MKSIFQKIGNLSLPLIAGIVAALIWANIDSASYDRLIYGEIFRGVSLHFLINDVFLVFFFAQMGVEIVRGATPGGNLYPLKNTIGNLFGALGGVLLPAGIFFLLNGFWGLPAYTHGWAVPTATDVAVSLLFAQIIFGIRHPAYTFLLLLAVADDIAGLVIIALFYPTPDQPVQPLWLLLAVVSVVLAFLLRRRRVRRYAFYLLAGIPAWFGLHEAGLHASLALIFVVPFMPHEVDAKHTDKDATLVKFEHDFKPIVDYGLFFFGLGNAGVVFANVSVLTLIIFISLLVGKTAGIFAMVKLIGLFGFRINKRIADTDLLLIGLTAGVGLTVSLFIAEIAYPDHGVAEAAKMGALFSLGNGFIAIAAAAFLHRGRFARRQTLSAERK